MKKIPLIVVVGATASGKTALSVELAKKFNGEIISADSMQIYRKMDIGTAKPTKEEQCGIPHHLMDCIEPGTEYSTADYVLDAHRIIKNIIQKNKIPIVVGGTGLYINSLVNDISFDEEKGDKRIRDELYKIADNEGAEKLIEMLAEFDPESAERISIGNVRRIIRAIEIYKLTGKTMTEHNAETSKKESRYLPLMLAVSWDRKELYERIDKRVDIMLENGLFEEVVFFAKLGYTKKMQAMQGIGYKQLLDYYRGLSTYEEAVRIIKRDTRRYAKRQLTWFKRDKRIKWIPADSDILKQADEYVRNFLAENQQIFLKL